MDSCHTLRAALATIGIALLMAPGAFAKQREVGAGQTYSSMQSCLNSADTGDVCNVHAGTYTEYVKFRDDGVTLQANPGDTVILVGVIEMGSFLNAVVDGFQITGFNTQTGGIHAVNSAGGIVRNNVVHDGAGAGIYVRQVKDFQVYGNKVHDMVGPCCITLGDGIVAYSTDSTDGTYARGVRIYNNEVYQNHQDGINIVGKYMSIHDNYVHDNIYADYAGVHPDGVECNGSADGIVGCTHVLVYNNVIKNQNQNIYFNGLGTPAQSGDLWIFNNVVYNDAVSSTKVDLTKGTSSQIILNVGTSAYILNNTIGGTTQYFDICLGDCTGGNNASWAFTDVHIKNNIITNSLFIGLWAFPTASVAELDNNFYFNNSVAMVRWGASGNLNNIAAVRSATGMEAKGQLANPQIGAFPTPTLQAGSPAIGAGANLTNLGQTFLNADKNGVARPASGAWDIGAFCNGSVATLPTSPKSLTVKAE